MCKDPLENLVDALPEGFALRCAKTEHMRVIVVACQIIVAVSRSASANQQQRTIICGPAKAPSRRVGEHSPEVLKAASRIGPPCHLGECHIPEVPGVPTPTGMSRSMVHTPST